MRITQKIIHTENEWKNILPPGQCKLLRKKGTEPAFSGEYWNTKEGGVYLCAACGAELFSSATKFNSGTGWPSFYAPSKQENVETGLDKSLGVERTEVRCGRCGGHLGHVFDDGPKPTEKRYCINSAALKLKRR